MSNTYKTKEDVLRRAQEAVGKTFGEIDKTGRLSTGKGAAGNVIEESWFGYRPNSDPTPDFEEAGVELKVTPFEKTAKGIRAKERLVCDKLEKAYRDFGATSKCWKEKISEIKGIVGEDYSISSKKSLTLVGELQFGNWALGYYDLLRLINATETVPIDYYIYVAATGKLEKCLSDGIVTYNKMLEIVKENQRIVKVPMWLIGIDIDDETPKII